MALMARTPGGSHRPGTAGARTRLVAMLAVPLLVVTACTADEPDRPAEPGRSVALRLETVHGADDVAERTRTAVETEIGDVLARYVVGAYLGDYPRQDFVSSFDDFTPSTARTAARDIEVLTGAGFADASSVRAAVLEARLSLFAVDGRVLGATAAVHFRFEVVAGNGERTTAALRGRLMLVDENDAWSVFGYDLALDDGGFVEVGVYS